MARRLTLKSLRRCARPSLRPALATLGGKLIAINSPYARRGVLWDAYRKHFGQPRERILVAQAASRTMNPLLPEHIVEDAIQDDAARAGAEYLAQFRSDIEAFLSLEIVTEAQRQHPLVCPPLAMCATRALSIHRAVARMNFRWRLAIWTGNGSWLTWPLARGATLPGSSPNSAGC